MNQKTFDPTVHTSALIPLLHRAFSENNVPLSAFDSFIATYDGEEIPEEHLAVVKYTTRLMPPEVDYSTIKVVVLETGQELILRASRCTLGNHSIVVDLDEQHLREATHMLAVEVIDRLYKQHGVLMTLGALNGGGFNYHLTSRVIKIVTDSEGRRFIPVILGDNSYDRGWEKGEYRIYLQAK